MFGMMLRVMPADNGGTLNEDLFEQPTITLAQVNAGNPGQSQYKDHFYFALNNAFLVTNLAGNMNIDRLQTYLNWLLQTVRGGRLFQFTELTKLPEGVPLSDIKDIQFVSGGNAVSATPTETGQTTIATRLSNVANGIFEQLLGNDTVNLERIRNNQLIEAKLVLRIKGKSKDIASEEYKRVMGALATNITNDSGIVVHTKTGNKFTGEAIKVKKSVVVECVAANRIVEEHLKQQMEQFLTEVRELQNE